MRKVQKFNMDARKYRGVIPPVKATSLRNAALPEPETFMIFGGTAEAVNQIHTLTPKPEYIVP